MGKHGKPTGHWLTRTWM